MYNEISFKWYDWVNDKRIESSRYFGYGYTYELELKVALVKDLNATYKYYFELTRDSICVYEVGKKLKIIGVISDFKVSQS